MKNSKCVHVFLLIFVFLLSGCHKSEIKVGICFPEMVVERWKIDKNNLISKLKESGASVLFENANKDAMRQYKQAKKMIRKGINILILAPVDKDKAKAIVEEAHRHGVKVIAYDRIVSNCDLDFYVGHDVIKIGENIGEYALKNKPKGNYVMLNGGIHDNNAHIIKFGIFNVLEPSINSGDISIVYEKFCLNWSEKEAFDMIVECVNKKLNFDVVMASNDIMAQGAIKALKKYKIRNVMVTGHDADLEACRRIVKGEQAMTIYKSIDKLSQEAVKLAMQIAAGQDFVSKNSVNNGYKLVPAVIVDDIHTVTKDNMKSVIVNSQFHKESEIF